MSALTADTLILVRAPFKTDKYGNPSTVRDWGNATHTPVSGLSVQPDASSETEGDRGTVITGWRVITRKGSDFPALPGDRVEFSGMTLEVDGEVGRYLVGGRLHHAESRLKRVTG